MSEIEIRELTIPLSHLQQAEIRRTAKIVLSEKQLVEAVERVFPFYEGQCVIDSISVGDTEISLRGKTKD